MIKSVDILEGISIVCLCIPYFMVMVGFAGGNSMFSFFPLGLMLVLPSGLLAVGIQKFKQFRKQPQNSIIMTASLFTIGVGILGWMLIYVVVGG